MTSPIAPYITKAGIVVHDYAACLAWLQDQYRSIYGQDIYLGNDSQDGQWIAIQARAYADCNAAAGAVYNAFSPATAQGEGLSSVVKINGIKRALPSSSTCDVTIVGIAGITITNGQITDVNNTTWLLPASVTIPPAGQITVTATCATPGAIVAAPGTLTKIKTPVYGWQTVTNAAAASVGQPVERDPALRARQSQSVAAPSSTILDGVLAAIAGISGVTRLRGYENNTDVADANGIPAKNVAILVEGGDAFAIGTAMAKLTPGVPTLGEITQTIISAKGSSRVLKFSRPTQATIGVALTVKALTGWSTSIQPIVAQAVADYINTLRIGENVRYFDVAIPAKIIGSPYASAFSLSAMTLRKNAGAPGTADIPIAYNEVPVCTPANVTFTVI
jgi:uncharacterized phage protein gp47/JayE